MGKTSSSWLTAVKRAFRSPTKDSEKIRNQRRRHDEQQHEQEDVKKKEKTRGTWLFRKPTNQENHTPASSAANGIGVSEEQKNAIALAMVTAATAEAAAMEVARLTGTSPIYSSTYHYSAVVIQTAFRGYLARRALRALKGLVKLQALVRGHNVRKQAKMTLRCMQALVRVQGRVLDQRMRQTSEGTRKSTFSDTNGMIDSRYLQDISDRRSMSKDGSNGPDDWDERTHTTDEVKAMLRRRKEASTSIKRERNLSQAFSEQMWRTSGRNSSIGSEKEIGEKHQWLDGWIATKPWDNRRRASTDDQRRKDPIIKTVEMDTCSQAKISHQQHKRPSSPLQRANYRNQLHYSPATPSPCRSSVRQPLQVRSASPRFAREERSYYQTPSLMSNYHYTGALHNNNRLENPPSVMPNYMAATESAKARVRSQSAPRQRAATPERERNAGAKKRLSYPLPPDPYNLGNGYDNMKSPSFKSVRSSGGVYNINMGYEQQSNYSSCRTESVAGDVSPSSAGNHLRRWLR